MNNRPRLSTLFKIYNSYRRGIQECSYFPIKLWIETTNRCNLACSLCLNKDIGPEEKGDMDYGLFTKIIDQVEGNVFEINLFHRGEPLLHSRILDMIKYSSGKNIRTRIHTNATLLDHQLDKGIIESGLDFITFSMDSFIKDKYEEIKNGARFEEVTIKIKDFLKIKKELKSKKPFCTMQLMDIYDEKDLPEIEKSRSGFLKQFSGLPLDKVTIRRPHNWGGLLKNHNNIICGKDKKVNSTSISSACTFPWYSLTVFFNGKVHLCPQDFSGKILLGDAKTDSLASIFNSGAIRQIREKHSHKDVHDITPCSNCDRIRRKTFAKTPTEYIGFFTRSIIKR